MSRKITTEEIKDAIESSSLRKKAKLLADNSGLLYLGKKSIPNKYLKQIYESVPDEQTEDFNELLTAINVMTSRRDSLYLFHSRIIYSAQLIMQTLEWIKEKQSLVEIYNMMYKLHDSLSTPIVEGIRDLMKKPNYIIQYSKERNEFVFKTDKLLKNIGIYRTSYLNAITQAKTAAITFENFMADYNVGDLVPFDITDIIESYRTNYDEDGALNEIYQLLSDDNAKEGCLFETAVLFPPYESIKPNESVIKRKIMNL